MDASFTFWSATVWTLLVCLFSLFSFLLTLYVTFVRRDLIALLLLKQIISLQSESLRVVQDEAGALRTAMIPHGESIAETLRALRELLTDLQALASIARETRGAATGLMTDPQAPATPVLLEILAELRKATKGDSKIQRRLPPFSLHFFVKAQAEALARERMQATPNPFHDLD